MSLILVISTEIEAGCWDLGIICAIQITPNNWNGQRLKPYSTDTGPCASPCCTRSPLVKCVWAALTSNSSLRVEEEAIAASNTNASATTRTTEATPSPAQSRTGTNCPPQMQFCPSPMAPSSRRCHPPPNKFQNFSPLPVSLSTLCNTLKWQQMSNGQLCGQWQWSLTEEEETPLAYGSAFVTRWFKIIL